MIKSDTYETDLETVTIIDDLENIKINYGKIDASYVVIGYEANDKNNIFIANFIKKKILKYDNPKNNFTHYFDTKIIDSFIWDDQIAVLYRMKNEFIDLRFSSPADPNREVEYMNMYRIVIYTLSATNKVIELFDTFITAEMNIRLIYVYGSIIVLYDIDHGVLMMSCEPKKLKSTEFITNESDKTPWIYKHPKFYHRGRDETLTACENFTTTEKQLYRNNRIRRFPSRRYENSVIFGGGSQEQEKIAGIIKYKGGDYKFRLSKLTHNYGKFAGLVGKHVVFKKSSVDDSVNNPYENKKKFCSKDNIFIKWKCDPPSAKLSIFFDNNEKITIEDHEKIHTLLVSMTTVDTSNDYSSFILYKKIDEELEEEEWKRQEEEWKRQEEEEQEEKSSKFTEWILDTYGETLTYNDLNGVLNFSNYEDHEWFLREYAEKNSYDTLVFVNIETGKSEGEINYEGNIKRVYPVTPLKHNKHHIACTTPDDTVRIIDIAHLNLS